METLARETLNLIGIKLTPHQLSLLEKYARELETWNQRFNLTAITDPEKILIKHFLDSFSCWLVMSNTTCQNLIDIGSGAGFPGIPLKIIIPDLEVVLVDSVAKKTEFCEYIIQELDLSGIRVIHERVERLAHSSDFRENFDWAVARAVAKLSTLSEYSLPFVRVGGHMLAMKGDQGPTEVQQAQKAFMILGGNFIGLHQVTLPGVTEERFLITIKKVAITPNKYPRRVGVPVKRPL
jgi:16S rRNA (guanine527-N7)-methyltransferase